MIWTALLFPFLTQALYFTLLGNSKKCLGLTTEPGSVISGQYLVSGQGEALVLTRVQDPQGKFAYKNTPGQRDGKFEIKADEGGTYYLCFHAFDRAPKTISFDYRNIDFQEQQQSATGVELDPFNASLDLLLESLQKVLRSIRFFEQRERVHRDLTESTCDRVLWSAVAKIVTLLGVSAAHVFLLFKGMDNSNGKPV